MKRDAFYLTAFVVFTLLFVNISGKAEKDNNSSENQDIEQEMIIGGVGFDNEAQTPVVLLSDKDRKIIFPIWIGLCEARSIELSRSGAVAPRPLTYDMVAAIMRTLNAKVKRIVIFDLKDGVYYARVEILVDGKVSKIDARPSDALALASRMGASIFVKKSLIENSLEPDEEEIEKRGT